jgi:hypothetical protein
MMMSILLTKIPSLCNRLLSLFDLADIIDKQAEENSPLFKYG